jgi:hexokinase
MIVEERLARLQALLIGAWCAFDGDRFDEDGTDKETIMRFLSMARDEVKAMNALGVEVLNIECRDAPTKA